MFTLDIAEAKTIMTELVQEFGEDYVNEPIDGTCMYFHPNTGAPSCGVGQLFARKGLTMADLDKHENHSAVRMLLKTREDEGAPFAQMDKRTVDFLQIFQYSQDDQKSWGYALSRALTLDAENYPNG